MTRVPRLHVVVSDEVAARPDFETTAGTLLGDGGAEVALHLRLKRASGRALYRRAEALARRADAAGGWLVVNERVDVALATEAQGVQLGAGALPLDRVRALLPPETAVGRSIHGREAGEVAAHGGANYLLLGTIFPSPTHPDRPGEGPELIEECAGLDRPVVAIGGITPERVSAVLRAGAHGVAAASGVWDADEPRRALGAYLDALAASRAPEPPGTSGRVPPRSANDETEP